MYFFIAVLVHIPDFAGLAGLIAGLSFNRRAGAIGAAVIAAALISLLKFGPTQAGSSFIWQFITNAPAAMLVAWFANWVRYGRKRAKSLDQWPTGG